MITEEEPAEVIGGLVSRSDQIKQSIGSINARDFVTAAKDFSEDVKFHAPGLGVDVQGREIVVKTVGDFVEQADVSYTVNDVVEQGPFVVAFLRSIGTIDSKRVEWDLCQLVRYEGDRIAEIWALRGGPPQPTSSS